MTPGVGPRAATKLLERFGSADAVFHARRPELESLRLRPETIESVVKREFHEKAGTELERVKQLGGDVLILDDGSYPGLLREIDDPPPVLYVKGDWQACFEQPGVGVIGSRTCSTYGENASEMLSRDLASRGITIVSGLARGIDAAAHRGAIRGQGRTIAVIGTGIDSVYPKENNGLVRERIGTSSCSAYRPQRLARPRRGAPRRLTPDHLQPDSRRPAADGSNPRWQPARADRFRPG